MNFNKLKQSLKRINNELDNIHAENKMRNFFLSDDFLEKINSKLKQDNIIVSRHDPQGDSLTGFYYTITKFKTLTEPKNLKEKLKHFFMGYPVEKILIQTNESYLITEYLNSNFHKVYNTAKL